MNDLMIDHALQRRWAFEQKATEENSAFAIFASFCSNSAPVRRVFGQDEQDLQDGRMPHFVHIKFPVSLQESSLVARILNFIDELYREFHDHAGVEILDPDAIDVALAPLTIQIRSKRFLAAATKLIEKASAHEGLQDTIVITRT